MIHLRSSLAAALMTILLTAGTVAAAALSDAETRAIHGFRDELVQALRDAKAELARYRAYRDESRWATIYDGWGYVDIERLADYVPIAQHVEDHPDTLGLLSAEPFWLDAPLIASVELLTDEAASSADVPRAAEALAASLAQTRAEKAEVVRPFIKAAREERELTITAIDTLDALIEDLGLPVRGPSADDVVAEPDPEPGAGPDGVMAAFHEDVMAEWTRARDRVRDCRAWSDDPDTYIQDPLDITGFDLTRLADYESAVEYIRDNVWAWAILDAPSAQNSTLDVATRLYLQTFQDAPGDLAEMTEAVVEANRQTSKLKRENHCVEILGTGKRHRDALAAALRAADDVAEALGLVLEPTPTPATPEPSPPPATPATPEPTPEPRPEPAESLAPNPFADL